MSSPQLHAVLRAHRVHCPAAPHPGEVHTQARSTGGWQTPERESRDRATDGGRCSFSLTPGSSLQEHRLSELSGEGESQEGWGSELESIVELFDGARPTLPAPSLPPPCPLPAPSLPPPCTLPSSLVGTFSITCLDPRNPRDNAVRDSWGAGIAAANTLVILSMSAWGYRKFLFVRQSYKPLQLLSWFVTYQTEQKQKHDAVASLPGNRRSRIDSEVDSTDTSARGGLPTSPK